jgi:hypothetical protein
VSARFRVVVVLVAALGGCGTGELDPFARIPSGPLRPPDHPAERCDGVDTDESKTNVPAELEPVTTTLSSVTSGEFRIEWARYPLPYPDARQWAIWGKGLLAANGRHYSAVGDGDSAGDDTPRDGNTVLYEYDLILGRLRAVGDVLTASGNHVPGENGYAKIQATISEGPCGLLYMHSYWGSPRFVTYTGNYQGDLLLRYNPWTKTFESLGTKIPRMGVPAIALYRAGGLIHGTASTPTDPRETIFWSYAVATDSVIFQSPRRQATDKDVAMDREGRAYYSGTGAELMRYDPATASESTIASFAGGGTLRASTRVASDGSLLLVTVEPNEVYRLEPDTAALTLLATLPRQAADIDLDPSQRVAYFVPVGLDGRPAFELYEINRSTGSIRMLVDLGSALATAVPSPPRGSYSINASADGRTLYLAANSGEPDGFGVPVFIAVHLPESALP